LWNVRTGFLWRGKPLGPPDSKERHVTTPGCLLQPTKTSLRVAILLALAACSKPPAPARIVAQPVATQAPKPVAARPAAPVIAKADPLTWHFDVSPTACHAFADAPGITLSISPDGDKVLTTVGGQRVQHSRNAGAVQFAFAGPAGSWNTAGRWHTGQITTETDTSDRGLANMLALLGGGSLHLSSGRQAIGTLEIAASGPDGRAWFNCARRPQDAGTDTPASAPVPSPGTPAPRTS
jgi:hypothetical protein